MFEMVWLLDRGKGQDLSYSMEGEGKWKGIQEPLQEIWPQ